MKDTAVLLIDCPDRKGLVARVAGMLYEHGANILHADQHQDHDLGLFFMRVEWALNGAESKEDDGGNASRFDLDAFKEAFTPLADRAGYALADSSRHSKSRGWHCSARSICIAWPTFCIGGTPANWPAKFR